MFLNSCISILDGLQVFNWRVVDCDLAIGLCTLLSKAEVYKILWKVIDNTWQNYDKILVGNMLIVLLYFIIKQCIVFKMETQPGKIVNTGNGNLWMHLFCDVFSGY